MAITYPLTVPNYTSFRSVSLIARNTVGVSTSPYTAQQKIYQWRGQFWEVDIVLKPMKRADAEAWNAFFLKLKGQVGTFYLSPDPNGRTVRGSASSSAGTPIVNGALSANSASVDITGATASATGYLLAGDYIAINNQLLKVLNDVNTNGSGEATIDIFPSIRTALSGSDAVTVSNAQGIFRLATNEQNINITESNIYQQGFTAVESIT
tara:strand:- start:5124 stop:5750 length:627 start_codon:yes stop_codon:yes gene_type:complete